MDLKCQSCGSSNIVEDDLYGQHQFVCADCGSVMSEGSLANDPVGGSDVSYHLTTQQLKRPCQNLRKGLQGISALCRVLRVNKEIEQSSRSYFEQAYNHASFINVTMTKKDILAGCCVLISCRILNWPITFGTICYLTDSNLECVLSVYQEAVKILKIGVSAQSITDVMESHCQQYKITSEDVSEELAVDMKELTKRAVTLVEMAAEAWIVTGRKPVPIMMAAIYLSWQSLQPTRRRQNISLDKFCHIAQVPRKNPASKRVTEIKKMLYTLATEIPWVTQEVNSQNLLMHVDDILKYRFALMRNALKSHKETVKEHVQKCDSKEMTVGCSSATETKAAQRGHGDTGSCNDLNWGKKELFSPPSVLYPKKRKLDQSNQIKVTGDEEISDGEIESYIRTPAEVRHLERAFS